MVYAVFAMSPKQVAVLTVASIAALGFTMVVMNHVDPVRYPAFAELARTIDAAQEAPIVFERAK